MLRKVPPELAWPSSDSSFTSYELSDLGRSSYLNCKMWKIGELTSWGHGKDGLSEHLHSLQPRARHGQLLFTDVLSVLVRLPPASPHPFLSETLSQ